MSLVEFFLKRLQGMWWQREVSRDFLWGGLRIPRIGNDTT